MARPVPGLAAGDDRQRSSERDDRLDRIRLTTWSATRGPERGLAVSRAPDRGGPLLPIASRAVDARGGLYDRARIEPLLENLIENAIKFSPAGPPVDVRVSRNASTRSSLSTIGASHPRGGHRRDAPPLPARLDVDERRPWGTGLGLFIWRATVEGYGAGSGLRAISAKGVHSTSRCRRTSRLSTAGWDGGRGHGDRTVACAA